MLRPEEHYDLLCAMHLYNLAIAVYEVGRELPLLQYKLPKCE